MYKKRYLSFNYENIFIIFLIFTIVPFLILSLFVNPCWDDFEYSVLSNTSGFWESQQIWYTTWSGRYFSTAFLSIINPLVYKSILGYKILIMILILVFILSIYFLTSEISSGKLPVKEKIVFSLSFCLMYFYGTPTVKLALFWLSPAVIYQFANILLIFLLVLLLKLYKSENKNAHIQLIIFVCAITIAICGSNEVSMIMLMTFFLFTFIINLIINKRIDRHLLLFTLVSIISFIIVYEAPGTNYRMTLQSKNHQLIYSFEYSLIDLIEYITYKNLNIPFISITILFIFLILKNKLHINMQYKFLPINPIYSIGIYIISLGAGFFTAYRSLGQQPFPRIMNVIYFIFLLGWFLNIFIIINYLKRNYNFNFINLQKYFYIFVNLLLFFSIVFFHNNIKNTYKDLLRGTAFKFDSEMKSRYEFIYKDNSDTCIVDSIKNIPVSFFFHDITDDPNAKYNKLEAEYFNKKYLICKNLNTGTVEKK